MLSLNYTQRGSKFGKWPGLKAAKKGGGNTALFLVHFSYLTSSL
jgi:hypothetical protein